MSTPTAKLTLLRGQLQHIADDLHSVHVDTRHETMSWLRNDASVLRQAETQVRCVIDNLEQELCYRGHEALIERGT